MSRAIAILASALFALPVPSAAQSAATPLPEASPTQAPAQPYVALQEEFSPKWDQASGSSNLLNVRGQLPFAINGQQYVIRIKLPFVTSAPSESVTGMSDSTIFFLAAKQGWLLGATTSLPTGGKNSLGTGKYSIGPGFGYAARDGNLSLGFFSANYFSVIGPAANGPVARSQIQPLVTLSLPGGWGVGTSTMNFTYSWTQSKWQSVPVGIRLEKALGAGATERYAAFLAPLAGAFELEKDLTAVAGTPTWTYRATLRWNFPRPKN